jgi:hypothetical protein
MCKCKDCKSITLLKGTDGVGIVSITDNNNGTFTILLSNGTTFTTEDLTGPQGPQGEPGINGEGFDTPLNWIEVDLINGWANTVLPEETPYYAISGDYLFMRGKIKHTSFTPLKAVFWEAAPTTTADLSLLALDFVAASAVQLAIATGSQEMSYQGPNNASITLSLDSLPIIRLY